MIKILYEDNHLLVVVKPFNMLSQSDSTGDSSLQEELKDYIKKKYNKLGNVYLGLVHRLDRPVGGVMVFAKTSKAASRLSDQIRKHQLEKGYLAVVDGILSSKKGMLHNYLKKLDNGNTVVTKEEDGKEAILDYEVIEENLSANKSLVKVSLKTGRHHQIRVQFASIGHPLCGDQRYGKMDRTQLALFAYHLAFYHPVTKEFLSFVEFPDSTGYFKLFTCKSLTKEK